MQSGSSRGAGRLATSVVSDRTVGGGPGRFCVYGNGNRVEMSTIPEVAGIPARAWHRYAARDSESLGWVDRYGRTPAVRRDLGHRRVPEVAPGLPARLHHQPPISGTRSAIVVARLVSLLDQSSVRLAGSLGDPDGHRGDSASRSCCCWELRAGQVMPPVPCTRF
jgi:hypothetical protein